MVADEIRERLGYILKGRGDKVYGKGAKSIVYEDDDHVKISVVCRDDAGILDETVHYGLAVTLEVSEKIDIEVYEEIREKLKVPIKIQEE